MINKEFNSIIEIINTFNTEEKCIAHLEELRWNGNIVSPFDFSSKVYKCKGNKYKCKNTGKYFNVKTGTIFDNTKIELQKWFLAIWLVTSHKKGISSIQLSKDINITQKSAWFMLQRIRECFSTDIDDDNLDGIVEIDETYVGGKNKNRHEDKKIKNSQGRSSIDKSPVVGLVERNGKLLAYKVDDVGSNTLTKLAIEHVKPYATIYTDEWRGYNNINKYYTHGIVMHHQHQYVNGEIYTNTIEGFWSLLKRGIIGIYHYTSKQHLQRYVNEFVFRYNTREQSESERINYMLCNLEHRLKYKELVYG